MVYSYFVLEYDVSTVKNVGTIIHWKDTGNFTVVDQWGMISLHVHQDGKGDDVSLVPNHEEHAKLVKEIVARQQK